MPTLTLLTHNVKMLPGPFGEGDRDLERAGKLVNAFGTTYDVVCLQEVFDEEAREVFDAFFKACGYETVPKVHDNDIFHEDSGLFFASKLKITGWGYEEFKDSSGDDALCDKGIFGARLAFADGNLCVFNTHLQATLSESEIRKSQLKQLRHRVTRALQQLRPEKTSAIALGDFNVVGESEEYLSMLSSLGYPRDAYREQHGDDGFTWDRCQNTNMIPEDDRDQQRLDFVLPWDSIPTGSDNDHGHGLRKIAIETTEVVRYGGDDSRLSDHFGVSAKVCIEAP